MGFTGDCLPAPVSNFCANSVLLPLLRLANPVGPLGGKLCLLCSCPWGPGAHSPAPAPSPFVGVHTALLTCLGADHSCLQLSSCFPSVGAPCPWPGPVAKGSLV